ncbi:hypothetical protein C1H76_3018 [Elsinoe australis]|uniref:Uncharacterized protein n=1 Tax=Elsinoe australis TaxID=40998 RepID=A0A4U7B183_9PEZI|nr:hypothetical protein C1H76_3018 [Elsinoe australis]
MSQQGAAYLPGRPVGEPITKDEIGTWSFNHPIHDAHNPSQCPCGNYKYKLWCNHDYTEFQLKCGRTTTKTGKTGFCKSPAPTPVVQTAHVVALCYQCPLTPYHPGMQIMARRGNGRRN